MNVIPVKTGTHAELSVPFSTHRMGPGLRRDDAKKNRLAPVLIFAETIYFNSFASNPRILVATGETSGLPSLLCTVTSDVVAPAGVLTRMR